MNKFSKLLLIATIFVSTTFSAAAVQYTTANDDVISINPFNLIWGQINAQWEHKLNADNSISVNAGLWIWDDDWSAFNVGASYKWYLDLFEEGKSSLNGLAVGPRLDFAYWTTSRNWDDEFGYNDYAALSIGAEVSYKWVFGQGKWAVEPVLKYTFPVVRKKYGFTPNDYGLGVNIGYCF